MKGSHDEEGWCSVLKVMYAMSIQPGLYILMWFSLLLCFQSDFCCDILVLMVTGAFC